MNPAASPAAPALPPAGHRLLREVRRRWWRALWLEASAWGLAVALVSAAVLVLGDVAAPLPARGRLWLRWLPPLLLALPLVRAALRARRPPEPIRFAMLAEEHQPSLGNRLVTAVSLPDGAAGPLRDAFLAEVDRALSATPLPRSPRPALRRPLSLAVGAAGLLAAAGVIWPEVAAESLGRWLHPRDRYPEAWREVRQAAAGRSPAEPPPPLGELRWTLHPPAYARLPATRGRGAETPEALPGSRLEVRGYLSARWSAVDARRPGSGPLAVRRQGQEWHVALRTGTGERGLIVSALAGGDTVSQAVLPIAVRLDDPPDVRLTQPAQDLVLASASGRITVAAVASDELGVTDLRLSWSRTRGSGETFEYLDGEWTLPGARPGRRSGGSRVIDLAALGLQPGDVLHVRAVARDANDVTGPGEGVSGTRVVRIARPDELDLVNTDVGFPVELPENPLLSQRMITLRTERLRDRAARLPEAELRRQAAQLAADQSRLREQVGEQVFTRATAGMQDPFADLGFTETGGGAHRHEAEGRQGQETPAEVLREASEATGRGTQDELAHRHDASPILEVNRTMQRLYDLMWASERELNQASPPAALPHQYQALRLIQELRLTERRFPRGAVAVDALDVAGARGTGPLEGAVPGRRSAAAPLPRPEAALPEVEAAARRLAAQDPSAAAAALGRLAARLLATPGVPRAAVERVARAADAAAAGDRGRARELLGRARSLLMPAPGGRRLPLPEAGDPASAEYFARLGRSR